MFEEKAKSSSERPAHSRERSREERVEKERDRDSHRRRRSRSRSSERDRHHSSRDRSPRSPAKESKEAAPPRKRRTGWDMPPGWFLFEFFPLYPHSSLAFSCLPSIRCTGNGWHAYAWTVFSPATAAVQCSVRCPISNELLDRLRL